MAIKILALIGKSGAGKDTIVNWMTSNLPEYHFNKIILTTTRPMRSYEKIILIIILFLTKFSSLKWAMTKL